MTQPPIGPKVDQPAWKSSSRSLPSLRLARAHILIWDWVLNRQLGFAVSPRRTLQKLKNNLFYFFPFAPHDLKVLSDPISEMKAEMDRKVVWETGAFFLLGQSRLWTLWRSLLLPPRPRLQSSMQPIHQIRDRLLQGLDKEYNVNDLLTLSNQITSAKPKNYRKMGRQQKQNGGHFVYCVV